MDTPCFYGLQENEKATLEGLCGWVFFSRPPKVARKLKVVGEECERKSVEDGIPFVLSISPDKEGLICLKWGLN